MRMWLVDPKIMCRKHLLGEHVEIHMLYGSITRMKNINGFKYLVEPSKMAERHDALAYEITLRGYVHKSPLPLIEPLLLEQYIDFNVNPEHSLRELLTRCNECRELYDFEKQRCNINGSS